MQEEGGYLDDNLDISIGNGDDKNVYFNYFIPNEYELDKNTVTHFNDVVYLLDLMTRYMLSGEWSFDEWEPYLKKKTESRDMKNTDL